MSSDDGLEALFVVFNELAQVDRLRIVLNYKAQK